MGRERLEIGEDSKEDVKRLPVLGSNVAGTNTDERRTLL
jgi:hypothetical protein